MRKQAAALRWVYLALGTVALLFAGILYAWSILKTPLAAEFNWSASALSVNFMLTMCCFCVGGMLGGFLTKRLGLRFACLIGACLAGSGFLLASRMGNSIGMLYLGYGVLAGLGIGIAYNCIISTINGWFPDKKGLATGVLMMGFGASTLVLGSAADAMIRNPAFGWRGAFRIIGVSLGIVLALVAFVFRKAPESAPVARNDHPREARDFTTAEMLKTAAFWKALIMIVFLAAGGNAVISIAKDLAVSVGLASAAATVLVGILSVCNGFGRILTGAAFDRFGLRRTMIAAGVLAVLASATVLSAILWRSPVLIITGLCLTGLSYGTCPTIGSAFTSSAFGVKNFPMNFAVMNCNLIFASFIAAGANVINASAGGYVAGFSLLFALSAAALLLGCSMKS